MLAALRSATKYWKFKLPNRLAIGWFYETEDEGGGIKEGYKYKNRVWSQYARRLQRSKPNWGCRRRGKEGDGRDLERAGYSHALYAGIGNCRVVEIACERRSSPGQGDAREGVRMYDARAFIYFA